MSTVWFTNVVKPTHRCNLDCSYCYNEDTRVPVMTRETLRRVITETFAYAPSLGANPCIDFIWHGGEPMVAGLDFFEECAEIQEEVSSGTRFANSIQTNGTLINGKWIDFFKSNQFDVSLSIDGPKSVNDSTRKYRNGRGSFTDVMNGIEQLKSAGIPHGVCVVLSRSNMEATDEIYEFMVREQIPFNVIPLTRSGSGLSNFEDLGLLPEEYAEPWIRLFDRWFESQGADYVQCSDFVRKCRAILIAQPTDCIAQEQCGSHHVSTDPDGFVYPCATLSGDSEWCYGNLANHTMQELMSTPIGTRSQNRVEDPHCTKCKWRAVCHGGCMARSIKFFGTSGTRDYYCPSLYQIYEHIESRLRNAEGLDLSALPDARTEDTRLPAPKRRLTDRRTGFCRESLLQIT